MARKPQENPQLDMTPMIDVVFELIIFFVVTLTEAQKKDETIELSNGEHGMVITADSLPVEHLQIDIASVDKQGKPLHPARVSISDRTIRLDEIGAIIKERQTRYGMKEFPVLIRADYATEHKYVAQVMNKCTEAGLWKISLMATAEDKTKGDLRPRFTGKSKKK